MTPFDRYAALAEALGQPLREGEAPGFGRGTLRRDGRIFAMLVGGRLVVKLTPARVAALVADGHADAFDPGHGRRMKAWAHLHADAPLDWLALARESERALG